MTWEWSHSAEAYDFARDYLSERVPQSELAVIAAEWDVFERSEADEDAPAFDQKFYADQPSSVLAEKIWGKMEVLRSATNGGHSFWGCPYGCSSHLIPAGD